MYKLLFIISASWKNCKPVVLRKNHGDGFPGDKPAVIGRELKEPIDQGLVGFRENSLVVVLTD